MLRLFVLLFRFAFGTVARFAGARATHRFGVAGTGHLAVRDELGFPPVEFLRPGARLHAVLRHANLDLEDDAALDLRGAALRLESAAGERLDLPMNTGEINTFQTPWVLLAFMAAKPWGALGYRWFGWMYPRIWGGTLQAYRHGPSSYTQLRYHSQIIFRYAADDGVERVARWRLVPANDEPESGFPSAAGLAHPFRPARAAGDARPIGYLRTEWARRVASGGARYRFQVQLHDVSRDDPKDLMDTSRTWDERSHPWLDVGELRIDTVMDAAACAALCFNIAHQPRSMGVLPARDANDFNAVGYLRTRVYPASQQARGGQVERDAV